MVGHMQQPLAAANNQNVSANDDSDTISLTSTVEDTYAPETEFAVEGIRAERISAGAHLYLVEWSNFPLDECTWEPEENLQEDLKASWEEQKLEEGPGAGEEFTRKCKAAQKQKLEESRQRHRRRNNKRRRLGLPTTQFHFRGASYPDSDDDELTEDSESQEEGAKKNDFNTWNDSESDEALEGDIVDHKATESLISSEPKKSSLQAKAKPQPRPNRVFTFKPGQATPKKATTDTTTKESIQVQASKQTSRVRELPSATGYQGSARRSSGTSSATREKQSLSKSLPTRPSSIARDKQAPSTSASILGRPSGTAMTARRTDKQSVNIFSGGKTRKKKTVSNERETRFYPNASAIRKSELYSRNREDVAPDLSKMAHLLTPSGVVADTQPSAPLAQTSFPTEETIPEQPPESNSTRTATREVEAQTPAQVRNPIRTASEPKSVLSKRSSLVSESGRAEKRAKSVRFTEVYNVSTTIKEPRATRFSGADECFVSEPMDIDETESPADSTSTAIVVAQTIPKKDVSKQMTLASSSNRTLNVVFKNVPQESTDSDERQSLEAFDSIDCLFFSHTVLAETLGSQLRPLQEKHLCSGLITSTGDEDALKTIADHLGNGHLGLFLTHAYFNLLIYPTKCDSFELGSFGVDQTKPKGIPLGYFMFTSPCPLYQLVRPAKPTRSNSSHLEVGQEMPILFSKILGVRLTPLLKGKPKHFFFAFPERALDWQRSFFTWLNRRDPRCKIYDNFTAGSWSAFAKKAKQETGVIIMHEALVSFIRRFPGVFKLLQSNCCSVWRFSESPGLQLPPTERNFSADPVITPMVSRIFTHGTAILVTPSFMLSQPQETYKLFKWFFANKVRVSCNKLITGHNIRDYLYTLAMEKSHQYRLFEDTRWRRISSLDVATEKNASALTNDDVAASQRTWLEVHRWLGQQFEPDVPFSEENHVIYADPAIDPNDEQSLVNWFGWWTSVHSDTYSNFYVVGSDASFKNTVKPDSQPLSRMSRSLKIPGYSPSVVNDPDDSLRASKKTSLDSLETSISRSVEERDTSAWPQSQQYFKNGEQEIVDFLKHFDKIGMPFTRVFHYPVSYFDKDMADHFGDHRMSCNTYEQWWKFPDPWLQDPANRFNTFVSLFYTVQEDWIPSNFPRGLKPRRHPWVVIYRPVEPHMKSGGYAHGRNELFIWDVRAGDVLEENRAISLADLTWMQRELVRYVQLHVRPGSTLAKVWLGGFQLQQSHYKTTAPMDITVDFFQELVHDIRNVIPSPPTRIPVKGYRPVSMSPISHMPQMPAVALNQSSVTRAAREVGVDEFDENTRIIFHPPRGSNTLRPMGTSTCTNDLFEVSRLAKLRDPNAKEMTYTYRPTMEWYEQQVLEGRQFEHICVGTWAEIDRSLNISNDLAKTPASVTSEQFIGVSRRSSMSSNHSSPKTS